MIVPDGTDADPGGSQHPGRLSGGPRSPSEPLYGSVDPVHPPQARGPGTIMWGANPPPDTVAVTATGGELDSLSVEGSFTRGEPTDWLTATLSATTTPASLALTAPPAAR